MTFSLHDSIDPNGATDHGDSNYYHSTDRVEYSRDGFHFLRSKLEIPAHENLVPRPRLDAILSRSIEQFPATLISGRAGTGKTALAAAFARYKKDVLWYSVESSDAEWPLFQRYFSKSISGESSTGTGAHPVQFTQAEISKYLETTLAGETRDNENACRLLILDDIHHIFDAEWFNDFFQLLLYSLPSQTHLLLLCRSKPPGPLWRLRSKQMLNVIDEKVIAFTPKETEDLFKSIGVTPNIAREAQRRCYGRVSQLIEFAEKAGPKSV